MKFNINKLSLALGLGIVALASTPAFAVTVEYSTSGSFTPNQEAIGFTGVSTYDTVVVGTPAYATLGTFYVSNTNYTANSVPFHLTITQAAPTFGTASFTGTLTGSISRYYGGGLSLLFNQTSVTIGSETYEIRGSNPYTIANHGSATLNAEILDVGDAPEPTFYVLTGTAFAGLLAMAIRRRRQQICA